MARFVGQIALVIVLATSAFARAQSTGSGTPTAPDVSGESKPDAPAPVDEDGAAANGANPPLTFSSKLFDRLLSVLSQEEDPDGPISTDRPTFTPANTVVPLGRVQFESGFTFNSERAPGTRSAIYDFPELAMRIGIAKRVEFRTFWLGQTYAETWYTSGKKPTSSNGPSDMEIGFKWQLIVGDKDKKLIPTTALITSIFAPTGGGSSPYSSESVEPYLNLIYGWSLTEKLSLTGCTGYTGVRLRGVPGSAFRADAYERYHQSLVGWYAATPRTTFFYEWYILMPAEARDIPVTSFMDGGILYQPTPNTQFDLRAGFGLNGRPEDFFTGAGFSVRF
jgi:hypothetical protein